MSWIDEICLSCGVCCTTLSKVTITEDDLQRLIRGYALTREQAGRLVYRRESEFRILMDKTATCPALSAQKGHYRCNAYEHRPTICRTYECFILEFAKEWIQRRRENSPVEERNHFHSAQSEAELREQVDHSIRRMRQDYLESCLTNQNNRDFRRPDYLPELLKVLSGCDFDHSFPPSEQDRECQERAGNTP
ncbi:MAG TPA: YkgJ family cysteine cluster protein [Bryobacteraceae bacterium]|nr:YkgJ family cysteine cluster protein [Bryobacteraceae bacterium]